MSVVGRHVVLSVWRNGALAALAVSALALGVARTLEHPGASFEWLPAVRQLARHLPATSLFIAACATLASLRRERALIALMAAGCPLRRIGGWMMLAGLPFAGVALAVEAWPIGARAPSAGTQSDGIAFLEGGGILMRGARADGRAALLADHGQRSIGWGRIVSLGDEGALRVLVDEEWSAPGRLVQRFDPPRERELQTLAAPRGLLEEAGELDLATLEDWLALEPQRADLRFARDAKLRNALRPLVLLLLGLGLWLCPFGAPFAARSAAALGLATLYLALELWLGTIAALGDMPATAAAIAPAALFAAFGTWRWLRADRPAS